MRRLVVAGVIGALGLSLAACGSSQDDQPVPTTTTQAPAQSGQASAEAGQQAADADEAARVEAELVAASQAALLAAQQSAEAEAARVAAEQTEAARAEAERVAAEAAAQAERDAQAAADQAAAEAAEAQAEHEAAERAVHEERERILAEGFTDENGTTYSPETVRRGVEAGIYPGDPIPGYLRCGTACGETPTSGELQAWNTGLVPVPQGYESYLAPNATPYDSCEAAADRVEYGIDDDGVVSCNPD